jgi:phosphoglycerate kinase
MKFLSHLQPEELAGKKVLLRLDLNVPSLEDTDRITKSLPTIEFLKNAGAKVIIISHIGRDPQETLQPIAKFMQIPFVKEFQPEILDTNQMVMLENLRQNPGEESKDELFAKKLASCADIYVNDAFAVSHRAHASIVGIPKFLPSYVGLQFEQEISHLSQAFHPSHPSILVLGGAKFETKLPVIQKFLPIVDHILIGGALVNNFYKEMGYDVSSSLIDESASISHLIGNPKIIIPETVTVESDKGQQEKNVRDVVPGEKIVDISERGLESYKDIFAGAQFTIWNGPLGNYENGFVGGTKKMVELIASSQGTSIVGGGDSVALIEQLKLEGRFTFLSTGGGAMLEYLANETLPGIDALESSSV